MKRQLCVCVILLILVFILNLMVNYNKTAEISKQLKMEYFRNIVNSSGVGNSVFDTNLNTANRQIDASHVLRPLTDDKFFYFNIILHNDSVHKTYATDNKTQTDHINKEVVKSTNPKRLEQSKTATDDKAHGEDVKLDIEQHSILKIARDDKTQTGHNVEEVVQNAKTERPKQSKTVTDDKALGEDVRLEIKQDSKMKTVWDDNVFETDHNDKEVMKNAKTGRLEQSITFADDKVQEDFKSDKDKTIKMKTVRDKNVVKTDHNVNEVVKSPKKERLDQSKTDSDDKVHGENAKLEIHVNKTIQMKDDNVFGEHGEFEQHKHEKMEVVKSPSIIQKKETRNAEINKPASHFRLIWDFTRFEGEIQKCSSSCKFVSLSIRRGRMGNNMFQVASLIGTAHDMDIIPVIKPAFPLKRYFLFPNVIDLSVKHETRCQERGYGVFTRCNVPGRNVSLVGFRQSWKYFYHVKEEVKNIFQFKNSFLDSANTYKKQITKDGYKIVGIHIRRGDITPQKRIQKGNAVVDMGFFKKAMDYFKKKYGHVVFIILSNDMNWCRMHLRGKNIVYSPFKDPGNDMALMTLCDNMILTYGSFGWWGAWLSGNPAVYFWEDPKPHSKAEKNRRRVDYYPPEWKPMTN